MVAIRNVFIAGFHAPQFVLSLQLTIWRKFVHDENYLLNFEELIIAQGARPCHIITRSYTDFGHSNNAASIIYTKETRDQQHASLNCFEWESSW